MRIAQIHDMETSVERTHESMMRSYQILEKAKNYLRRGMSPEFVLELIDEMESPDGSR